jgi:hypothetical protein
MRLATATIGVLVLSSLLVACGASQDAVLGDKIGDYTLTSTPDGLEIRSVPDQHPNLNRLLARISPRLERVGLPSITLSPTRILECGSLGNETEWPRSEVASVTVQNRVKRGIEAKNQGADRSWRVLLLRKDGHALRTGFGFALEADARAFAAAAAHALGTTPQDDGGPTVD